MLINRWESMYSACRALLVDGQVRADPYPYYLPALVHKRVFVTLCRGYEDIITIILSGQESRGILNAALIPDTQFCYTCTRATNESFYLDKEG